MIRLRQDDFDNPHELAKLAATARLSEEGFRRRFERLVATEPPPLVIDAHRPLESLHSGLLRGGDRAAKEER